MKNFKFNFSIFQFSSWRQCRNHPKKVLRICCNTCQHLSPDVAWQLSTYCRKVLLQHVGRVGDPRYRHPLGCWTLSRSWIPHIAKRPCQICPPRPVITKKDICCNLYSNSKSFENTRRKKKKKKKKKPRTRKRKGRKKGQITQLLDDRLSSVLDWLMTRAASDPKFAPPFSRGLLRRRLLGSRHLLGAPNSWLWLGTTPHRPANRRSPCSPPPQRKEGQHRLLRWVPRPWWRCKQWIRLGEKVRRTEILLVGFGH